MTEKIIATVTDKKGAEVIIKHSTQIAYTPAISPFMRHHAELMDKGWSLPIFLATNRTQVIYAEINGQVVGEIAFEIKDDAHIKLIQIYAGAVEQPFRGRGIYKFLHTHLEALGKAAGCKKMRSDVHSQNKKMMDTLTALGKRITFHRTEKDIT